MSNEQEEVKREVAAANRVLANLGLATGLTAALGHAAWACRRRPIISSSKGASTRWTLWRSWKPTTWSSVTPKVFSSAADRA